MQVLLRNKLIDLKSCKQIGQGGEAIIFESPHNSREALKVSRNPSQFRDQKLRKFFELGVSLPSNVMVPQEPLFDPKSGVIMGFVMQKLEPEYVKLNRAFKNSFCKNQGITQKSKVMMSIRMLEDLHKINAQGFVVGDFNDNNEMFHQDNLDLVWIDVDSMQFADQPCIARTMVYVHPELYNADLSRPMFKPYHDHFSFSIMVTSLLLNGLHPFKSGFHPRHSGFAQRAESGITIFDKDVEYPKRGLPPEVLTNDMIDIIQDILKQKHNIEFPMDVLKEYGELLVECKSCGVSYPATRNNCPGCSNKTTMDMQMKVKIAGIEVTDLIKSSGRIIYFQQNGKEIYSIAVEDGQGTNKEVVLYKKMLNLAPSRHVICDYVKGSKYRVFDDTVVVCPSPTKDVSELFLYSANVDRKYLTKKTTTAFAGRRAVFAASDKYLYRIAGNSLMAGKRIGDDVVLEEPIAQIYKDQTWFTVRTEFPEKEVIFGLNRIFGEFEWFLLSSKKDDPFIRKSVDIPRIRKTETLLDLSAKFDSSNAYLVRKTRYKGKDFIWVDVIAIKTGEVIFSKHEDVTATSVWDDIHLKAFGGVFVMHSSEEGVVRENLKTGETTTLPGTENYVLSEDRLAQHDAGFMVIKESKVILLKPTNK